MTRRVVVLAGLLVGFGTGEASAQVFGTFAWQMQPYCNLITLTITQIPGGFTVDGHDNQCGGGKLAGAGGMALINPDGTVGLEFTIVTAPSGRAVHVSASLDPATGSGAWTDSIGNSGHLALGAPGSGPVRPVPASGLGPATVTATELAPSAVGATQLAANAVTGAAVADGSLAMVDIANGPRAAFSTSNSAFTLTSVGVVYASVALTAPGAGKLLVNASGYFTFDNANPLHEYARCSLTTGTAIDVTALILSSDAAATIIDYHDAWAGTRGFTVPAAGPVTVNLVCDYFGAGVTSLKRPQMTALFVAQ